MKKVFALALISSLMFAQPMLANDDLNQDQTEESNKKEKKESHFSKLKASFNKKRATHKEEWNKSRKDYLLNHKALTASAAVTTIATVAGVSYLGYVIYKKWKNSQEEATQA
jgi:uncharacterized membrane protein YebE (DUF533 family)